MQPLIGVSTDYFHDSTRNLYYNRIYVPIAQSIVRAGGLPVGIPSGLEENALRAIYERMDAVMIPGGPDIDPKYFGQEPHPTITVDPVRDVAEVNLIRWGVADDLPVMGICRGHQVVNVALGGSLIQDIPSHMPNGDIRHYTPTTENRGIPRHTVQIDGESRLSRIFELTEIGVNSLHHQAVDRIAPGMVATAYSPDGIVEGLEMPDKYFVMSVQWHPEDMVEDDPRMLRLFEEFVNAARGRTNHS